MEINCPLANLFSNNNSNLANNSNFSVTNSSHLICGNSITEKFELVTERFEFASWQSIYMFLSLATNVAVELFIHSSQSNCRMEFM